MNTHPRKQQEAHFFAGPDLWFTMQEIILETGDQHAKGIERLATDRSRQDILAILAMMRLWESLRGEAA